MSITDLFSSVAKPLFGFSPITHLAISVGCFCAQKWIFPALTFNCEIATMTRMATSNNPEAEAKYFQRKIIAHRFFWFSMYVNLLVAVCKEYHHKKS